MRVLDPDRVEVRDNAEWLDPMTMAEIMSYAREVTVARLLERDDFARRFTASTCRSRWSSSSTRCCRASTRSRSTPTSSSAAPTRRSTTSMGRDLQRAHGQPPQAVLTVPLLVGTDGVEKMGKSLGNWIGIEEPPDEQFGKVMSIPDSVVGHYATLCHRPAARRGGRDRAGRGRRRPGREPGQAPGGRRGRRALPRPGGGCGGRAPVRHGAPPARGARRRARSGALPPGDPVHLPALLVELGFARSSSAARRLVDDGAVRLDGDRLRPGSTTCPRIDWPGTCSPPVGETWSGSPADTAVFTRSGGRRAGSRAAGHGR